MPPAEDVHLWLHLDASIGARQWQEQGGHITALNRVHQHNRLYGDPALMPLIKQAFSAVPDIEIFPSRALNKAHSELGSITQAGYTAFCFVGSHRFFYTREDVPMVTDAVLLPPMVRP